MSRARAFTATGEPNLTTAKTIVVKIYNEGKTCNRRELFWLIKRLPDMKNTYAWMVMHNLLHERPRSSDTPSQKREIVVELTEAGQQFIDRLEGRKVDPSAALPPVAYAVDRQLYAKLAVTAIMNDQKPEDELTRLLAEYTENLDPVLFGIAKKKKPELFF